MEPLFLSYSRKQAELAKGLYELLGGQEAGVFLDTEGVEAGADWVKRIGERLVKAGKLLVLVTPESMASDWVRNELSTYLSHHADFLRRSKVVPLLTRAWAPLPPWLAAAEVVDLAAEGSALRLVRELGRVARGPVPRMEGDPLHAVRRELNAGLAPLLKRRNDCDALARRLSLPDGALEGWRSEELAANAALVRCTADSGAVAGVRRLLQTVRACFEEDETRWIRAVEAQLPPEGGDPVLEAWMAAMEADHRELVNVFRKGVKVELDEVFVGPAFDWERGPERGATSLLSLLRDPPEGATNRWVVKGDPGSGKTTLLRHVAWALATDPAAPLVPLYASLPSLQSVDGDLLRRAERRIRQRGLEGLSAALSGLGQAGRLVVLLDGLDEVPAAERDAALGDLREIAARWPQSRVVVSSRPLGFTSPGSAWRELKLLPFDRPRQLEFLGGWFGSAERATEVLDGLGREVGELASNPLYLTLVALLVEHGARPSQHRATLYDQVFELLLGGLHRGGGTGAGVRHPEVVGAALREIALTMTEANRDAASQGDIEAMLTRTTRERAERDYKRHDGLDGLWDDLTRRMHVLVPYADAPDTWRWWHRSFREAWAARALHYEVLVAGGADADVREGLCTPDKLAGVVPEASPARRAQEARGLPKTLERAEAVRGQEGQWAEPFALLSGRLAEPDRLLLALGQTNGVLACRALSSARRVSAEVVGRLLELGDDPEARRMAFLEVPAKVGDPERAVDLLERLGGETTDPKDLCFVDLTLLRLAGQRPEAAEVVERARARLYHHLPAPVGVGLDERLWNGAPLWAEVPAGEGWIGSEQYNNEKPRFRFGVTAPFRVLAVPVTNRMWAQFQPDFAPVWPDVPSDQRWEHPVVEVSWWEAWSFSRWIGHLSGLARLPTEYEWEYACRAGTDGDWWCDEQRLSSVAWLQLNSGSKTHRPGELGANDWGLFDVHGNVWEWTASQWTEDHRETSRTLLPGDAPHDWDPSAVRVVRGGSWSVLPGAARSACRDGGRPGGLFRGVGFRVLLPAR